MPIAAAMALGACLLPHLASHAADQAQASLDEHVNALTSELRCLVCQNQTIADSQSELARQLKAEVRQQLARGASDQQVRDFMVQRYGDFVLYRPRVTASTVLLWIGPAVLLAAAMAMFAQHWRQRRLSSVDDHDSRLDAGSALDDQETAV